LLHNTAFNSSKTIWAAVDVQLSKEELPPRVSEPVHRAAGRCAAAGDARSLTFIAAKEIAMKPTSSDEKRVQFDFAIEFLNGGGIQGQEFRLDIAGDDIAEEALADYIVRDLRLLMVGRVRILNKKIIAEPHKRGTSAAAPAGVQHKLVDLSHTVEDGMITYKGLPAPIVCDHLSRVQSRQH
jgi:hypothetical protein